MWPVCTKAIDTAHSLEIGKGLTERTNLKAFNCNLIDSRQIGVYIYLGHDQGVLFGISRNERSKKKVIN